MVQQTLLFLLGFLVAGFLALMLAPAVWRRSAELTRRRIEAAVPLSREELQAQADRVRAESAMAIRRLEMELKAVGEKSTLHQATASRQLEEIAELRKAAETHAGQLAEVEQQRERLARRLTERETEVARLSAELSSAVDELESRMSELDRLMRVYEESALVSTSSQIELVARETRIEHLVDEVAALKQVRNRLEAENRNLSAELKALGSEHRSRERKVASLEKKVTELMIALSDAEERLYRREMELGRLRGHSAAFDDNSAPAAAIVARLEQEREQLEARLKELAAENRRLRTDAVGAEILSEDRERERRENEALRNEISALAAEFVNLTALLEGGDLVMGQIDSRVRPGNGPAIAKPSIADRVRALREAALAEHPR